MTSRRQNPSKRQLLPEALTLFFHRRIKEILGLVLVVTASIFVLSLYSYDPDDPSFNTAVTGPIQNIFGLWGAHGSDFFKQHMGELGYFLVFLLLVWGLRLIFHRPLSHVRWKALGVWGSLFLLATGFQLSGIPSGSFATMIDSLLSTVYNQNTMLKIGLSAGFIAFGGIGYLYSLSLSWEEWKGFSKFIKKIFLKIMGCVGLSLKALGRGFRKIILKREGLLKQKSLMATLKDPFPIITPESERDYYGMDPHEDKKKRLEPVLSLKPILDSESLIKPGELLKNPQEEALPLSHREGDYQLPPFNLLQEPPERSQGSSLSKSEMENSANKLKGVLEDFGIRGDVVSVRPGPVVTLYELVPAPGIKASRIISLADDIARSMSALSARVAVIPGKNALGIELPNKKRQTVYLRELFSHKDYEIQGETLALGLGKDISGYPIIQDLARMPHLLVAGTTGSGKSVAVNAMILSLLFRLTPDQCKFIMIDPKMLELSIYEGIPHLLTPVVTDPKKAIVALKWVVREMENRYRSMSEMGVRNIQGYNDRLAEAKKKGETLTRRIQTGFETETGKPIFEDQPLEMDLLPNIVVVVDEMADLMLVAGKEVEAAIQRLAQMARAAGIHIIMATQRPSVDVITGTIKANFPTRISFQVTSKIDSRTILGEKGGAEQLLGQGDMLYMAGGGRITRIHGPFVSDKDVEKVVTFLKSQEKPTYVDTVTEDTNDSSILEIGSSGTSEEEILFAQAVDIVRRERKASTSFIQRCLKIGYNRAARLVDQMEKEGIVSSANHVGRREVLIPPLNHQE